VLYCITWLFLAVLSSRQDIINVRDMIPINCHLSEITELDKNDPSRKKFQMALRGFCI